METVPVPKAWIERILEVSTQIHREQNPRKREEMKQFLMGYIAGASGFLLESNQVKV